MLEQVQPRRDVDPPPPVRLTSSMAAWIDGYSFELTTRVPVWAETASPPKSAVATLKATTAKRATSTMAARAVQDLADTPITLPFRESSELGMNGGLPPRIGAVA